MNPIPRVLAFLSLGWTALLVGLHLGLCGELAHALAPRLKALGTALPLLTARVALPLLGRDPHALEPGPVHPLHVLVWALLYASALLPCFLVLRSEEPMGRWRWVAATGLHGLLLAAVAVATILGLLLPYSPL